MKRLFILVGCVFVMMLFGCSQSQSMNEKPVSSQVRENTKIDNEVDDSIIIGTEYYTIALPSSWDGLYGYEVRDLENGCYALNLYEKDSYNQIEGGFLFSVQIYYENEDYSYLPSYDEIGILKVDDTTYNVIVEYPTDVQFSEQTARQYQKLANDIDRILMTIQAKEGYTYSVKDEI